MTARPCEFCGKAMHRGNLSWTQWAAARFCSQRCWSMFRRAEWTDKHCSTCGKKFSVPPNLRDRQRFCSIKCAGMWRRTKKYTVNKKYRKTKCGCCQRPASGKFCSTECEERHAESIRQRK